METKDFTERFLYHIWDAGHLAGQLKTASGKLLKIISAGRYSSAAGPDFREAVIALDNNLIRGDVEIHKTTYDWKAHGHQEDLNFSNLVLHVVYQHNTKQPFTVDKLGRLVEIFELKNFLDDDIKRIFADYQKEPQLPKEKFCCFFAGESAEIIQPYLIKLGVQRLYEKQKRFSAELFFTGFNQLAYKGIMEALGYSKNKFQMLQLADLISYEKLRSYFMEGMNLQQMIAIWLGATGLIDTFPSTFPTELILKWKELYSQQSFCSDSKDINWQLFRLRPVNHPAVRLLQISELVFRSMDRSLFNDFIRLFSFPVGKLQMKLFYQRLYQLFLKPSDFLPEKYKLGKTRLDTIFINIVLPLVMLYAHNNQYQELSDATLMVYKNYHALPDNHLIKSMRRFMDDSQAKLVRSKAVYQQAILHLYHSFCRFHTCRQCLESKNKLFDLPSFT